MDLIGIKNIVFDWGGVILTLERDEALRRFRSLGIADAEEQLNCYHQHGIFLLLEEGKLSEEEFFDAFRREAGRDVTAEEIRWAWRGFVKDVPAYKLTMLETLRAQGYRLYLLSNTNPCLMGWGLSKDFSPAGKSIDEYFDKLYLSYEMGKVKPDKGIFEDMIKDSGLVPGETLFIDDGEANVRMGESLGFHTYQPENGEDFRHLFGL